MFLHYTGNQLQSITNYACPDDFEDYTPYPVSDSENAYSYDQNGNTTKDLDRNILSIQYNLLNLALPKIGCTSEMLKYIWHSVRFALSLPRRITYTDGSMATYTYNSLGEKLRVVYATSSLTASLPAAHVAESEVSVGGEPRSLQSGMPNATVDYCGDFVYNGAGVSRILLGGEGYCRLSGDEPLYFFFIKDHLGSTRAVVRQDGRLVQSNQYYPYGKSWEGGYSQPYLYNGKELDMMHGLEWYDYGARMYDPGICRFMTMDPLCEKYYSISPYAYCGGNPVNRIDLHGDSTCVLNYGSGTHQHLAMLIQNDEGKWSYYSFNGTKIFHSTSGKSGGAPHNNLGERSFESPTDFLNSKYNSDGSTEDIKQDKINGYGYTEGYILPTTPKEDGMIKDNFVKAVSEGYNLLKNQCAHGVQKALNSVGIKTTTINNFNHSTSSGSVFPMSPLDRVEVNPYLPSSAFKAIRENNPNGIYIKR